MEGNRLGEIPPSRYAKPPPLPPLPTLGLNAVCWFFMVYFAIYSYI